MESNDLGKRAVDPTEGPMHAPDRPDYARGLRTLLPDDAAPDFARGERSRPRDPDVEPDFARGERTRPRDPAIKPDFARGERTRPVA
jgi:hypothetical protein